MNAALLVPGVAAAAALVLALVGYRMLRADPAEGLGLEELMVLNPQLQREAKGEGPLGRIATRLAPPVRRRLPQRLVTLLQRQVDLAGRPDGMNVDGLIRSILVWVLIVAPAALLFLSVGNVKGLALCVLVPLFLPLARLSRMRRLRRESLDRDLPDFLDILAVTVTAGVGFRQALMRVSQRYGGPLAEEMQRALRQVEHGASLRSAFVELRERSDSEALAQFVTAFLQTDELGAPLVDALNQIAVDMRRAHAQRMRRKAGQVAPRVTLVTSVILVPATLILLLTGLFLGSGIDFGQIFGGFSR